MHRHWRGLLDYSLLQWMELRRSWHLAESRVLGRVHIGCRNINISRAVGKKEWTRFRERYAEFRDGTSKDRPVMMDGSDFGLGWIPLSSRPCCVRSTPVTSLDLTASQQKAHLPLGQQHLPSRASYNNQTIVNELQPEVYEIRHT